MIYSASEPKDKRARVLIVDDDRAMCQLLTDLLREDGYEVDVAYDGASAIEKYQASSFEVAITDLMMPKMKGVELVARLREIDGGAVVLLITAFGTIESAVEAMRAGALHYVTKPFHNDEILMQVKRALEQKTLRDELKRLRTEVDARNRFHNIVGQSEAMQRVFEVVAQVERPARQRLDRGRAARARSLIARAVISQLARHRPFSFR